MSLEFIVLSFLCVVGGITVMVRSARTNNCKGFGLGAWIVITPVMVAVVIMVFINPFIQG